MRLAPSANGAPAVVIQCAASRRQALPIRWRGRQQTPSSPDLPSSGQAPLRGPHQRPNNSAGRDLTVVRFHHHIVSIREGGDLCEMGDHNHLGVQGQPGEAATHLHRDLAANTCVDLVEDQSDGFAVGRRTTSRPAGLATVRHRRHSAQTAQLAARVGGKHQIHPIGAPGP